MKIHKTLSLMLGLALAARGLAAEHPEHPAEHPVKKAAEAKDHEHPAKAEHPEHPKPKAKAKPVKLNDVAKSAAKWAKAEQKKAGGRLTVRDEVQGKDLQLKFVKIHKERLSKTAPDTYFVCADFKDQDGQVYDMDIFMQGTDPKKLAAVGDLKLHKQNGKARYSWVQKDGIWTTEAAQ